MLLAGDITDKKGKKMNAQTAMATAIMYKAISGDVRAFLAIKETLGEVMTAQGNELLQSIYDLERGADK